MMTDLFDLAEGPEIEALRRTGAWPAFRLGMQFWQLPDSRCVSEEEALAWLRRQRQEEDIKPNETPS
ncbi:MAG: hypothetical protein ACREJC_13840 [Tepidisphaeraceae bacterium]